MKKLLFAALLSTLIFNTGFGQCTPPPATDSSYFYPPADSLPCIVRGEPFYTRIYFEIMDSMSSQQLPFTLILDWWMFDSIAGLPNGISYQITPQDTLLPGETGCIEFYGTTHDSVGTDSLYIYVTMNIGPFGLMQQVEIGSLNQLLPTGIGERYYLQVVEPGTACATYGNSFVNFIQGSVFYDANNNGIFDSTDGGMANITVELNPGQVTGFTRQDGSFHFFADSGNYTVSIAPPANYSVTGVSSYNVQTTTTSQTYGNNDFGLYPSSLVNDLKITLTSGIARPGFITSHWIHYQNAGTVIENGTISYRHDPALSFLSSSVAFTTQSGNNITWDFSSLFPGGQRTIYLQLQVPNDNDLRGDTLISFATITSAGRDSNLVDNKDTTAQIVTGSYDPNDKQVSPDDVKNGVLPDQLLTYTVRFQNTGTDTAFTVVIRDTLDEYLNTSSFQTVAASHPYAFQLEGGKYAIWTFNNILLPDSGINEPLSHGFVKYAIRFKNNIPDGTTVNNSASIYFDFNDPVKTNTVAARVEYTSGIRWPEMLRSTVFPNPASGEFSIMLSTSIPDFNVYIVDISGKTVLTFNNLSGNQVSLDARNLENGIYFYHVVQEKMLVATGKLAVMHSFKP